tara:strand:+ start:426 stop:752 length:327 start_codon:yes stop_codon:yes gene_type:complete
MKRLLDYDPLTRTETWHCYDHQTKRTEIKTVQDVERYIQRNKRLANDSDYKAQGIKNDWFHIGTVPNGVILEWKQKHNVDVFNPEDHNKIEKLLSSPEYKYLRTCNRI